MKNLERRKRPTVSNQTNDLQVQPTPTSSLLGWPFTLGKAIYIYSGRVLDSDSRSPKVKGQVTHSGLSTSDCENGLDVLPTLQAIVVVHLPTQ